MRSLLLLALLLAGPGLGAAEYDRLWKELKPPAAETWRTIPWRTSLLEAHEVAAREKKPLFLWAMDGHPLGCT